MNKAESEKILCFILYNGLREKLNAFLDIFGGAILKVADTTVDVYKDEMTIYFKEALLPSDANYLKFTKDGVTLYLNNKDDDDEENCYFVACVILICMAEVFSQGDTFEVNWEKGINEFGLYTPQIEMGKGIFRHDGTRNFYSNMVDFLSDGIADSVSKMVK